MDEVGGPAGEVVEDVGGVDDGALAVLRLALEPGQELGAAEDVEVDGDLVEQEHSPGSDEPHGQLDAAALAVGHGVHAPVDVDVEHMDELVAAVGVGVTADGAEELIDANVSAHNGVQDPLEAKIGDALEALLEGVDAADRDGVAGGEALACEEAEERGLAGTIGADQEGARARGQVEGDIADAGRVVGERVREVLDFDTGRLGRRCHDERLDGEEGIVDEEVGDEGRNCGCRRGRSGREESAGFVYLLQHKNPPTFELPDGVNMRLEVEKSSSNSHRLD